MTTRTRARTEVYSGYRVHNSTNAYDGESYISLNEETTDVTGLGDNNPFYHNAITRKGGVISGEGESQLTGHTWYNYPCTYQTYDSYAVSHLELPDLNEGDLAIDTINRTNPSRASLESLNSLFELRELPSTGKQLFKESMDKLYKFIPRATFKNLSRAAKLNLIIQFGVMPVIGDIQTLMKFQDLVDQRVKELNRLYGARGLRRTIDLYSDSDRATDEDVLIHSNGVLLRADIHKVTVRRVRGHIRWYATMPNIPSTDSMRAKAKDIILGNQFDLATLYEAMPWSWLIDYFVNLGDFVSASRNLLNVTHQDVRLITERITHTSSRNHTISGSPPYEVRCSAMDNYSYAKSRVITSPSLSAQTAFLTGRQMSILGSLAVIGAKH